MHRQDGHASLPGTEAGKPVRVRVYGPDDQPKTQKRSSSLGEILDKAKEFDIDVTEF